MSVTTCPVNKCDYIYFVHSYDDRRMIGQLDPGWADDVTLAFLKKQTNRCFCHRITTREPGSVFFVFIFCCLPRVSINSTREPLLSQNKLLTESEWMSFLKLTECTVI